MTRPTTGERVAPRCEACGGEMFISEHGDGVLECTWCNAEPRYCHHCGARIDDDGLVAASDTELGACAECAP